MGFWARMGWGRGFYYETLDPPALSPEKTLEAQASLELPPAPNRSGVSASGKHSQAWQWAEQSWAPSGGQGCPQAHAQDRALSSRAPERARLPRRELGPGQEGRARRQDGGWRELQAKVPERGTRWPVGCGEGQAGSVASHTGIVTGPSRSPASNREPAEVLRIHASVHHNRDKPAPFNCLRNNVPER